MRFLCVLLLPASLLAQSSALKLDDLLAEALRRNPEILAAQKRYEAARQRPDRESALPDPTLSVGYSSSGGPWPGAGLGSAPTANAGLMLSQEFPFPGKRKLRGEVASKQAEAAFEDYELVQLSVVSRLKQAYHSLHHAYEAVDILSHVRDDLRELLKVAEARYAAGKAPQQDIFKAETQLAVLDTRILREQQERRVREAEINSLVNRRPETPLARPPDTEPRALRLTLDQLYALAEKHSPLLHREEKMIQGGELALNLARKDYYPDYTLSGGYFNMGSMPPMYEVRVDVKLPGYFWRKQRAQVHEEADNLSEAKQSFEAADQSLHYRIKEDFEVAQTSYKLMKIYETTILPEAKLTFESSLPAYETGSMDFLSVLTNLMATLDYELDYHEQMMNAFVSTARLEELTGAKLED